MTNKLSFDSVPDEVSKISEKITRIENLLLNQESQTKHEQAVEKLLTVREVAYLLNVSTSSIYSKISKKEIPFMKKGAKGRVYFFKSEVLRYLSDSTIKPKTDIQAEAKAFNLNRRKKLG